MAAVRNVAVFGKLFERVSRDEFKRGIGRFATHFDTELQRSAQTIAHSDIRHVGIITGFPCNLKHTPPTETDGPLGAFALARSLLLMGKKVTVVTDDCNSAVMQACRDFMANGGVTNSDANADAGAFAELDGEQQHFRRISLASFPAITQWTDEQEQRLAKLSDSFDHVIAIERAGPAADGTYRTMRALDMSHLVAPLERIMELHERRGVRNSAALINVLPGTTSKCMPPS